MKRCPKCNVKVNSVRKTCPLCLSILETKEGGEYKKIYPSPNLTPKKKSVLLKILSFLSVVGIFTSAVVNYLTYTKEGGLWSIIVAFNIGYFWVLIKSTLTRRGNIAVRLVIQTIAISLTVYIIDLLSGNTGWAINYVIPFTIMAALLSIISITLGSKERYQMYFNQIVTGVILGFIPIIFRFLNIATETWPAISALSLSVATIIGMIIFGDRHTKDEIRKRFHI